MTESGDSRKDDGRGRGEEIEDDDDDDDEEEGKEGKGERARWGRWQCGRGARGWRKPKGVAVAVALVDWFGSMARRRLCVRVQAGFVRTCWLWGGVCVGG